MSRQTKRDLISIGAALFLVLAFGLSGRDDYAEAKVQELYLCQQHPVPTFCGSEP